MSHRTPPGRSRLTHSLGGDEMLAGLDKESLDLAIDAFRDFARDKLPEETLLDLDEKDEFPDI